MRRILIYLTMILMISSIWLALTAGQIMPVKRNILYAHIPSSVAALLCFVVVFGASVAYLCSGKPICDLVAAASAEVGAVFATVLNVTGMIFSRAEWNTWWTPSPRLITAAILWFLYIVYLILRANIAKTNNRRAKICAIFGIIAFLDVPMVFISARFLPDIHRPNFSFDSSWQTLALVLSMITISLLAVILIWLKIDSLKAEAALEDDFIS